MFDSTLVFPFLQCLSAECGQRVRHVLRMALDWFTLLPDVGL